jgi:hypothetical protein
MRWRRPYAWEATCYIQLPYHDEVVELVETVERTTSAPAAPGCIKIDRALTDAVTRSPESDALIRTLVRIGNATKSCGCGCCCR